MPWNDEGLVYRVPYKHAPGEYAVTALFGGADSMKVTYLDYCEIVGRATGKKYGGREFDDFRIYHVDEKSFAAMTAVYDENGLLKNIGISGENSRRLLYIRIDDPQTAERMVRSLAGKIGKDICAELLRKTEKARRLFAEYYWDGMVFDYHVIYATEADVQKVRDEYAKEYGADYVDKYGYGINEHIDHGGEYSHADDNMIKGDNDRMAVILSCIPREFEGDYFRLAVSILDECVKGVIPQLDRTDDFKFISKQYD